MNVKRVLAGAIAGGVVWSVWSFLINFVLMRGEYTAEGQAGMLLAQPRYGVTAFVITWFATLFLLAGACSWLYAAARRSRGPGPQTALKVGVVVGFAAGFPITLLVTSWAPLTRTVPLAWLIDMWIGAILATVVAGWFYQDKASGT